jgi:carbon-monoxide dehydrogenase medium subunit
LQVPAQFDYEVAASVEEAIELLQRHGPEARLLAGGHSLIPMMKLRLAFPEVLIDIHELDGELRYVREDDGVLRVGALARHKDLLESPVVRGRYALLADAEKFAMDGLVRVCGADALDRIVTDAPLPAACRPALERSEIEVTIA